MKINPISIKSDLLFSTNQYFLFYFINLKFCFVQIQTIDSVKNTDNTNRFLNIFAELINGEKTHAFPNNFKTLTGLGQKPGLS